MKKKVVIVIIIVVVIIGISIILKPKDKSDNNYIDVESNNNYIAVIHYSDMDGMDAGSEYIYYIYPNENNTYSYVQTEADITISGVSEKRNISSGIIKDKSDFNEIERKIKKYQEEYIYYYYINNGNKEKCNSIEELIEKLF